MIDVWKFNFLKVKFICKISIKINLFFKIVFIIYKCVKKDYLKNLFLLIFYNDFNCLIFLCILRVYE